MPSRGAAPIIFIRRGCRARHEHYFGRGERLVCAKIREAIPEERGRTTDKNPSGPWKDKGFSKGP